MEPRWLSKAPVVEALIDIQIAGDSPITLEQILSFEKKIKEKYPIRKSRIRFKSEIKESGEIVNNQSAIDGYLFVSPDNKQVVQTHLNGYSYSRLAPYIPWEDWTGEAKELWLKFKTTVSPSHVKRIAVRTINSIKIPTGKDIKDFIHIYPEIAKNLGLPEALAGYMMRLIIPDLQNNCTAIVTQSVEPVILAGDVTLSLDIDVFRENVGPISDEELWNQLGELRSVKNKMFFAMVDSKILTEYI